MKVRIPPDNLEERKYILSVLLTEFLGYTFRLIVDSNESNWVIELENGNKLVVKDFFFRKFPEKLRYLNNKNIPRAVELGRNEFTVERDVPVIYGINEVRIMRGKRSINLICGIDIFASSFFMLTRWEEYVNKTRDKHNRFPASASLAFKNGFLHRPVVNEYVEMLWNMLKFLGCKQERKRKEFKFVLTHDVDCVYKYRNKFLMLRELLGNLIIRGNMNAFKDALRRQVKFLMGREKDPYDTYDYLMDISEEIGVKSYFFLHSSSSSKFDNDNDKYLKEISDKIRRRGHFIGYHPSYDAYNNYELFVKDKKRIEDIVGQELTFGRQHYLRFEIPTTWRIWEEAGMEWDSTVGYADREGFRCGTCYPYSVFDIVTRRKLKLKERPLIVMDGSFITYQSHMTPREVELRIVELINKVRRYNGEFVFLWHNSSFNSFRWNPYQYIYRKVLLG